MTLESHLYKIKDNAHTHTTHTHTTHTHTWIKVIYPSTRKKIKEIDLNDFIFYYIYMHFITISIVDFQINGHIISPFPLK